ncbi:N-terminal kinase-like protein [Dendronephthya gigantea]|uniref:N-terminal kinase-like protein n=1 Tax=Dendronephthya gigantea TaxID=151771 RepID=UPI00106A6BE2|nr:N-terminal kinase-like protein [Dendronephthya gigantea]
MQGFWNLIGKVGQGSTPSFPYEIGDKISSLDGKSIWSLHRGKKKGTSEEVSIFVFDVKNSPPDQHEVAKAEFKRLRTLRHPTVLRYVDGLESESVVYIVTESVTPLEEYLNENRNELEISWGIRQIATALDFLINNAGLIHGNICLSSIFVDRGGEWKLGRVAYVQPAKPASGAEVPTLSRFPWMQKYEPPEGAPGSKLKKRTEKWSADVWGLGCLIWEIFNGPLPKSSSLKSVGKIPGNLLSHYGELVSANPKTRPDPAKFIAQCRAKGQYLANSFVESNLFLAEIQMKSQEEQKEFFKSLSSQLDSFPQQYCKMQILPLLLNAFEYGSAGSTVLAPLFKIGKLLEAEEYQQRIVPCVVKLFSSTDRATRIQLLQQLDNFVQYLQPSVVNDQIFPNVALGFGDTVPAMREHTIKSMLLLTPKLTEKTINNQLLKFFAKLQMDEQPSIRTNTTVCLGKIARHLPEATRQKVIVAAFLRALRDPFPPAKMAGINALCGTLEYTAVHECATRVLPALCTMTIDPDKSVRDQTFKAIRLILGKVEKSSEDVSEKESATSDAPTSTEGSGTASGTWTGWAMSSISSKLYKGSASEDVQGKETRSATQPRQVKSPSKVSTNTPEITSATDRTGQNNDPQLKANSDSDYEGDEWGEEGWQEDEWDNEKDSMSSVRKDLMDARNELSSAISHDEPEGEVSSDKEEDSDSDFGDWDQDNWGKSESNSNNVKAPASNALSKGKGRKSGALKLSSGKKKSGVNEDDLLSELMSDTSQNKPASQVPAMNQGSAWDNDWSNMKDSFVQDDNWTESFFQQDGKNNSSKSTKKVENSPQTFKISTKKTEESKKSKASAKTRAKQDTSSQSVDGWGSDDWAPLEDSGQVVTNPSSAAVDAGSDGNSGTAGDSWDTGGWDNFDSFEQNTKESEADKARKKREERRKQREQALKEKRAAKGGSKLGAVKK